jgi:arsenite methyltransferase
MKDETDVREAVKAAYGKVAEERSSCCGPSVSCCAGGATAGAAVPEADLGLSCGDPVTFSRIRPGDVVLDLGSGAGKDVFIAAEKAGPDGHVIGVDMTPSMLDLARRHADLFRRRTGLANVEFRQGTIEDLPVDDASVDLVISNCVINLSPDKPRVFREVFRVLKPGGTMVVSDLVLNRPLPAAAKQSRDLYVACVAGALLRDEYLGAIRDAGFPHVELLSDRTYHVSTCCSDPITATAGRDLDGVAASITVAAAKP